MKRKYIKLKDYEGYDRRGNNVNGFKISTQLAIRGIYLLIILTSVFLTYKFKVEATEKKVDVVYEEMKVASKERAMNEHNISLLQKDIDYIRDSVDNASKISEEMRQDIKKILSHNDG